MISREELVEQSVTDYARDALFTQRGYSTDKVELAEDFPYTMESLPKNLIALGFSFDDQGEQAELGSDLKRRIYTIQFFVFGKTNTWGRNLANIVKSALERDGIIPLKDYGQTGAPVIDQLLVHGVSAERQIVPDPEPWQEFIYTVHLHVEDVYPALLV